MAHSQDPKVALTRLLSSLTEEQLKLFLDWWYPNTTVSAGLTRSTLLNYGRFAYDSRGTFPRPIYVLTAFAGRIKEILNEQPAPRVD
jgi:hypothetical protein